VTPTGAVVEAGGARQDIAADTVVIATGFAPDLSLRDALEAAGLEVRTIGDCNRPRNIDEAIWEGFHTARVLE